MRLPQIAHSLLENDLYKFNMGQGIYHQFPEYETAWAFKCRNEDVKFTPEMVQEISEQVEAYCQLQFREDELTYLSSIPWMKRSYIDFLRLWHPRFEDFTIVPGGPNGLFFEYEGTWLNTSMYEIPSLYIINEVYFRMAHDYDKLLGSFMCRLEEKFRKVKECKYYMNTFSDFGLRRRLSFEAQDLMVQKFSHLNDTWHTPSRFVGTSDVYLARRYNLKPIGTVAHEWTMCIGQGNPKHNPAYSNWYALEAWVKEYGVLNGIALTDTITTDCFLEDFKLTYATLFSGVRHDSGDPIVWGAKMLQHYKNLGIDPMTKTLLFSDSLNFERATQISEHFRGQATLAFGIGTYLTNDTDVDPLNIVLKPVKCNGFDIAKLSDVEGKGMCKNQAYIDYLRRSIDWRLSQKW